MKGGRKSESERWRKREREAVRESAGVV